MQINIIIMIKGSSVIEGSGEELDIKAQVFYLFWESKAPGHSSGFEFLFRCILRF